MGEAGKNGADCGQEALAYLEALYGFAMTLTGDRAEAEDLVQETYLRAVRACGHLLPNSNLKSWLFAIMRNAWLNQLRRRRSGPRFVEMDAEEGDRVEWFQTTAADPYVLYIRKLERREVRAAIESLPPLHREIIILRDIEGFSYQQIAEILGCPAGTVMSRLGRARERLRGLLAEWRREAARAKGS